MKSIFKEKTPCFIIYLNSNIIVIHPHFVGPFKLISYRLQVLLTNILLLTVSNPDFECLEHLVTLWLDSRGETYTCIRNS